MKYHLRTILILMSLLLVISLVAACGAAAPAQQAASEPTQAAEPAQAEAAPTEAVAPTEAAAPTEEAMAEPEAAATEEVVAEAAATEEAVAEAPSTESSVELPEANPLDVTGDIISAGSSTVFPLSERMAERFKDEGYAGNITIDSIGSGAGFERFCKAGETDIANASRGIKEEEVANCTAIGRTPIEFRVGTDALAIVVSKENDFLTDVTKEQLAQIFSTAEKWSDVDPSWPAETIQRFSPGTDSGTFDYFVEAIMDPMYVVDKEADKGKGKEAILNAAGLQLSEDDNVLAQGVEGSPYAIGYFGYAYYQNQADKLNILSVEGVEPSFESAESGDYVLARPLFIYSDAQILADKPQVAAFINFYLSYVDEEIEGVGYFPASGTALDAAKQSWLDAASGGSAMAEPGAAATEEAVAEAAAEVPSTESSVELPEANPLDVTGDIISAGSSTVFPLSERMAERFKDEGYAGNITIDSIGTGAGFERFCKAGETDIANASRGIKEEEVANCTAIGRTPIEFRVGTDALAIVVSKENDFLTDVSKEQLAQIFSTAEKWSDVDPSWPAETIQRFSPGTDSGTFDYFVEAIMDPTYVVDKEADKGKGKEAILNAAGLQLSEDDNVLAQGVEGSPYAIGYFGYAYYQNQADKLNILSVEGVEPSFESAESGDYVLARPLFIYSDAQILADKPQVAAFINFYLSYVDEEIEGVGYFPASGAALDAAKQSWLDAGE